MKKPIIEGLFPTPVYRRKLDRKFTEQELNLVEKTKTKCMKNYYNKNSADSYILNHPSFSTLKKEMDLCTQDYFTKVLVAPQTVSPYITQSWLNYTEMGQSHHAHSHENSCVSGVLYINADIMHDEITFKHGRYNQIKIPTTKWNPFNSYTWFFPVETGDLIMFPSHLTHLVTPKKGNNTRISLSFNVFVKGDLGSKNNLTELKL